MMEFQINGRAWRRLRPAADWQKIVSALVLACLAPLAWTSNSDHPPAGHPLNGTAEDRIVVFGDVHGGNTELRALLRALRVIDGNDSWIGGRTRLVSLGDLLDRGPDSRATMDLLMELEDQAAAAGGRLHLVLGNHEIMNLTGDLRYVAAAEYAAFAADEDADVRARELDAFRSRLAAATAPKKQTNSRIKSAQPLPANADAAFAESHPPGFFAHRAAFAADGRYGSWLLSKPQILVLERTAFVHGGLSEAFALQDIADYNRRATSELRTLLETGERLIRAGRLSPWQDLLTAKSVKPDSAVPEGLKSLRQSLQFDPSGPSWYRGTATCHTLLERTSFEAVLNAQALDRIVMGHTPTNPRIIQSRFDGRAILADTGMYGAYYRGRPSAVIFAEDGLRTLTLNPDGVLESKLGSSAIDVRSGDESRLLMEITSALEHADFDRNQIAEIVAEGRRMNVIWRKEGSRERSARLAALALDKLLGFGLIAPIVAHEHEGRKGTAEVIPAGSISETTRATEQLYRPNHCGRGSDFDLMLILDALIGQEVRTGENLFYDRVTWLIYLTGQKKAFPLSERLPRYLEDRQIEISALVVEQLAKLTTDTLEDALGEHLSRRQIEAILARRALLLAKWPQESR